MKKTIAALIAFLLLQENTYAAETEIFSPKIAITDITVIDGDTFKYLDTTGAQRSVRLWGVDADEIGQKCNPEDDNATGNGASHKQQLVNLIRSSQKFECHILVKSKEDSQEVTDRWGRNYGVCYADNVNIITLLPFTKTLTNQGYKDWIRPEMPLLLKVIKEIADAARVTVHASAGTQEFVDELITLAEQFDIHSANRACKIRVPAEWRKHRSKQGSTN